MPRPILIFPYFSRILERIAADQKAVMNPDVETPFATAADAVRRLLPYHVFHHPNEELEYATRATYVQSLTSKGKGKEKELDVPPHSHQAALEDLGMPLCTSGRQLLPST